MKSKPQLPRLSLRFLNWFCPPNLYESIEGDLLEQFEEDVKLVGDKKAKRRFVWNTLKFFRPGILLRNQLTMPLNSVDMIVNNLRFTIRHLSRQKLNSSLHIVGLTLGISVCLLIGLFIRYETRFDSYHDHAERIYRVNSTFKEGDINFDLYATPILLADAIRQEMPTVEKVAMTRAHFKTVIEVSAQKHFKQEHVLIVEPDFLDIFKVEVIRGNGHEALRTPYQALLTKSVAEKFYGEEDPVGKTFKYKNRFLITVAGIINDLPAYTNLPAEILLSYTDNNEFLDNGDTWFFGDFPWAKISASTFVRLTENTSSVDAVSQLQKIANKNLNAAPTLDKKIRASFSLQPLNEIHFSTDRFGGGPWVKTVNVSWLWFFAGIGVIVLGLACINFLNLSTAQALARSKEVGIRKSIGAQKNQLIIQFLSEASVLVTMATIVSLVIVHLSMSPINQLLEKNLSLQLLWSPEIIGTVLAIILLTIVMAGFYPAWMSARFNPLVGLKSNFGHDKFGSSSLRKVLVTTQFTVSSVLLITVLVIAQQVDFMRNKDLGFDKENIIHVEVGNSRKAQSFVQQLKQVSAVKEVSLSRSSPISNDHWWNSISQNNTSDRYTLCAIYADEHFYSLFRLHLLSGRIPLPTEFIADSLRDETYVNKVVVNENLLKTLNLGNAHDAIGKHFWWGSETEIVGVVSDFNTEPLSFKISPTLMVQDPSIFSQANIKIEKGSNLTQTLASIEAIWKENFPEGVFEVKFLDEQINSLYKLEIKLYTLFKIFAGLAIVLSCLGLWGLITLAAHQRTKEIGIRKVLGASVNAIVALLSKDFLVIVAIAFGLASPLAYYLMNQLLSNFAYHVDIGWQVFVFTGIMLLLITIVTISSQVLMAALANPVNSLKNE
jgi:putative ABC transport system permease protein